MAKTLVARTLKNIASRGGIIVFFVMAFEVMIMISPFAFFFYSVFNPVFRFLDHYPATSWLTSFFLPHMILPPTVFLKAVRILGSVFFIVGCLTFIVCACQIYLGKILRWGVAQRGLYAYIRHPQYVALGTWGIGMSILWPRMIVLATLSLMFVLYLFLARDEEKRMLGAYGASYEEYMQRTGRFFPRWAEQRFSFLERLIHEPKLRNAAVSALIVGAVMATGFALRSITLDSLSFEGKGNVTLLSMLPEDDPLMAVALDGIAKAGAERKLALLKTDGDYLGYLMPADYVMQGMIADTGSDFHLYKQHNTVAMISEWVLHPFQHLRSSPSLHMAMMHGADPATARRHHCPLGLNDSNLQCSECPYRRVILVEVRRNTGEHATGKGLLSFDSVRTPLYCVDVNAKTGDVIGVTAVGPATAWQDVPTPAV